MHVYHDQLEMRTHGKGLYEITDQIESKIDKCGIQNGTVTVFVQHTSCSIVIMENADPNRATRSGRIFRAPRARRCRLLHARCGRQRRHAITHPHGPDAHQRDRANCGSQNAARHVARHFPLRTSPGTTSAKSFHHDDRRMIVAAVSDRRPAIRRSESAATEGHKLRRPTAAISRSAEPIVPFGS